MKRLMILRGHQGSGKSTYSKGLIAHFLENNPDGYALEVSYDDILVEQNNGEYNWSPETIKEAQNEAWERFREFVKSHGNRDNETLIVHSATNRTEKSFRRYVEYAIKRGYKVEIERLTSFFENTHNCSPRVVAETYAVIEQNPIKGELILPCLKEPSEAIKAELDSFKLRLDPKNNSYVNQGYLNVYEGNKVRGKRSALYPELTTYKYTNRVFFDNDFDDALLELRGLTMDDNGNIVIRPFNKAFNLSEREAINSKYPLKPKDDDYFNAIKKINGFLGCATYVSDNKYMGKSFNNKVLYSTTGTLDSDYAVMVENHLSKYEELFKAYPNHTFLFEIVDVSDPHIIEEVEGEYLLACRDVESGKLINQNELRSIIASWAEKDSSTYGQIKLPEVWEHLSFKELKDMNKAAKHEGFVLYDEGYKEIIFKLKTPYYLITKFLGRNKKLEAMIKELKKKRADSDFIQKYSIDEEFFPLIDFLSDHIDEVIALDQQGRIEFIRNYLTELYDTM